MKKIKAKYIDEKSIVMECSDGLEDLYETIENEENFILECDKGSKVIIANNIIAKIRNGEIELSSEK